MEEKNVKSRKWLITGVRFKKKDFLAGIEQLESEIKYVIYQDKHLLLTLKKPIAIEEIKKLFPGAHLEIVNGLEKQCISYVLKLIF